MVRAMVWLGGPAGPVNESAKRGGERWVYEIADPGNGIDARTLGRKLPLIWRTEKEITFVGKIPSEYIKSATSYRLYKPIGPTIYNPGFRG